MKKYNLVSTRQTDGYDSSQDPGIFNSFSTAAFRFGHSMVQGMMKIYTPDGRQAYNYQLRENFMNTSLYTLNDGKNVNEILRGMTIQHSQKVDSHIDPDLTNHLFNEGKPFGMDLMALNIQRGRDHGLPPYSKFRTFCGMKKLPSSFQQSATGFDNKIWKKLGMVYEKPDDIDLFTGGIVELPEEGGLLGPTFSCIIAKQFRNLKIGDRYFFTHLNQAGSLSAEGFASIRKRTMRDILCGNTGIKELQANVFKADSHTFPC